MNIQEFQKDSFMAGYMCRDTQVQKTVRRAKHEHKNVVKALQEEGLFDFRTMTLKAEQAYDEMPKIDQVVIA
jgi:hypothetical protein